MKRVAAVVVAIAAVLAVVATSGQAAQSCTIYWTGTTSTDWFTTSNWSATDGGPSAGRLPDSSDLVCMSTAPATATVALASGSVEVGGIEWGGTAPVRPHLTLGGTLQVDSLADTSATSSIYNIDVSGTLVARGPISTQSLTLEGEVDGPARVTVVSGGTLQLGGSAAPVLKSKVHLISRGTATQATSNNSLELSDATFENAGAMTYSGQITGTGSFLNDVGATLDGDLSIGVPVTNRGTMSLNGGSVPNLVNRGTLAVTSGTVTIGASGTSNTDFGTFSVSSGATLVLAGSWTLASGASTSPSSRGTVQIPGTATAAGSNTLPSTDVTGTLIAQGSISMSALTLDGELDGPGTATVTGALVLYFTKLDHAAHLVCEGSSLSAEADTVLSGGSEIENSGTFTVLAAGSRGITASDANSQFVNDSTGTVLGEEKVWPQIAVTFHNAGTIMVPAGAAEAFLVGGASGNTDTGTINVGKNATLDLNGSWTLANGTSVARGSGGSLTFDAITADGNNTLQGVTGGDLTANGPVSLSGSVDTIAGPGATTVPAGESLSVTGGLKSGADLVNEGTATVNGNLAGGSTLENKGLMWVGSLADVDTGDPSQVLNDSSGTMSYSGSGTGLAATINNDGTISVPSGSGTFGAAGFAGDGSGTFAVSPAAELVLGGSWSLSSGALTASSALGTVQIAGTTTAAGSDTANSLDVTGTLISQGSITASSLTLEGELDGPGAVTVPKGGSLVLGGASLAVLKAGADLLNDGSATQDVSQGTLDLFGASRFENGGSLALADGQGVYDQDASHPSQVVNDASGTLSYAGSSGSASVSVTPALTNHGAVDVTGGTLSVPALTNLSAGVLTGGSYHVLGGTLAFAGDVQSNVALIGLGATGGFSGASANALTGLRSNTGTLTLKQSLALSHAFSNSGTVNVGQGTTFSAVSFTQSGGTTALAGGSTLRARAGSGLVKINAGELRGNGAVAGELSGAGTVLPGGTTTGPLAVSGSYDGSTGTLLIPVSGTANAGSDYGQLSASGAATLGGTLTIATKSGYEPPAGTTYTILKAASVTGTFSQVNGATLSDRHYVVSYTPTSVVLTVEGPPAVSGVSPRAGSTAGGNSVTITGSSFVSGASVAFGTVAASSVSRVSDTQLKATAPAHAAGTVNVTVHTVGGTSATGTADYYAFGAPTVTAISPNAGSTSGGKTVTISGSGFVPGATVSIGQSAATSVTVVSAKQLTASAPAHAAGTFNVVVHTPAGSSAAGNGALYAYGPPALSSLSPQKGSTVGGNVVTISGSGFVPGATVAFGQTASAAVTYVSGHQLKVKAPAHPAGTVNMAVRTPGGTSSQTAADKYTYGSP